MQKLATNFIQQYIFYPQQVFHCPAFILKSRTAEHLLFFYSQTKQDNCYTSQSVILNKKTHYKNKYNYKKYQLR